MLSTKNESLFEIIFYISLGCFFIYIVFFSSSKNLKIEQFQSSPNLDQNTISTVNPAPTIQNNPYILKEFPLSDADIKTIPPDVEKYSRGLELSDDTLVDDIKDALEMPDDISKQLNNSLNAITSKYTSDELYRMNLDSMDIAWYKFDPETDFKVEVRESPDKNINIINNYFPNILKQLIALSMSKDVLKLMGVLPYYVIQYNIYYYDQISYEDVYFDNIKMMMMIIREKSYIATAYYIDWIVHNNNMYIRNIEVIGRDTMDSIIGVPGKDKNTNNTMMNMVYQNDRDGRKDDITETSDKLLLNEGTGSDPTSLLYKLVKEKEENLKHFGDYHLRNTNVCFNTDETNNDVFTQEFSKEECERGYDFMGNAKNKGVWDKPCVNDNECPFYQTNSNYTLKGLNRGGCNKNTGQCEMPKGIKAVGYHYYQKNDINNPLCYNCDTTEWSPNTKIGTCCSEQENREKYPHLSSPDYVYPNDHNDRLNAYVAKHCEIRQKDNKMICS